MAFNAIAALSVPVVDAQSYIKALEPFANNGERQGAIDAFNTGLLPPYNEPSCRGTVSSFNVGAALETTAEQSALGSVPFVGGLLDNLLGGIQGHHAAAVKLEQATLCQAVPLATAFLQSIDQLVFSGQLDAQTAAAALNQGFQNWRPRVRNILKDTGGKCNAACAYEKYFLAAIAGRKLQYFGVGRGTVGALTQSAEAPSTAAAGQLPGALYAPAPVWASAPSAEGVALSGVAAGSRIAAAAPSVGAVLIPSSQSGAGRWVLIGGGILAGVVVLSILRGGK